MQRLQEILFLCSTIVFTTSENLTKPNLLMSCLTRSVHLESPLGNEYYVSWLGAQPDKNWLDAKTYCRKMSMDLVSLETHAENMLIKEFLTSMGIEEIWTSGRLCNFPSCQYKNEWFWTASLKRIPAAHDFLISDWALEGPARQPDNKSFNITGKLEECLSLSVNEYDFKEGLRWHDELCEVRKPFICEDNHSMVVNEFL